MVAKEEIIICKASRRIFQFGLLWPKYGDELRPGLEYKIKLLLFFIITGTVGVTLTIHLSLAIKNGEEINPEEIALLIAAYGSYYMVFAFLKSRTKLAFLLKDMSNFEKFGFPPNFDERNKQLNVFVIMSFSYVLFVVIGYSMVRLLGKKECKKYYEERNMSSNHCGLVAPFWLPFDIDYFPMFQFWVVFYIYASHMLLKMALQLSSNALELVQHLILRIDHLKIMILECFDKDDAKIQEQNLKICVLYHIEILDLASRIDNTFFNIMFGHFALTGCICACLEKQIVDGFNVVVGILHFIGWILALFVSCIGGQYLLNASEIIPATIWESGWYKINPKLRRDLIFMLARSQQNLCLRAGPVSILGYPLFISVLKTSYSIMCVLTS